MTFYSLQEDVSIALTNTNKVITATATASATSEKSQEEADMIAKKIAKKISQDSANTQANLVNSSNRNTDKIVYVSTNNYNDVSKIYNYHHLCKIKYL
jgi:hypothetical protein